MASFIPPSLLGEVEKLVEREKSGRYVSVKAPSGPQQLSTRAKAFAKPSGLEPMASLSDFGASSASLAPVTQSGVAGGGFGSTEAAGGGRKGKKPGTSDSQAATQATKGSFEVTSQAKENAFVHPSTAKRLAHLTQKELPDAEELAFVYDSNIHAAAAGETGGDKPAVLQRADKIISEPGQKPLDPSDLHMVAPVPKDDRHPDGGQLPSLKPTTRKEVALLKHTMIALLHDIGSDLDQEYPTEMHAFLKIIQEEAKIYDAVFAEIIRQVTVNMIERGEVLAEIRKRYGYMFTKIPKHVKHLHTELVAQRKLNRRLSEELVRAKETVTELWSELDAIRKHDAEVSNQAQEAQEKLVSVLTQSDNTDEILEEYHKLYRMQRDRLEEAVRVAEQEKKVWIDAGTQLALRIGQEHDIAELSQLQRSEQSRLRATNHMIVIISNTNDSEMTAIERKIEDWRSRILRLSQSVVEEDQSNIETLSKMQRDMKIVLKNLTVNEPKDVIEAEHPMLKVFHLYDVKSLAESLMRWVDQITMVAIRFTSDRDLTFQEELASIRKVAVAWIEAGTKLLRRNEKNANHKDYVPLSESLSKVTTEIEEWMTKLDTRVSGEDGLASHVISLQNQLEDRYTTYRARDFDKPLPPSERQHLKESLGHWCDNISELMKTLSNTSEKEQYKVPLHVENWVARMLDQMNTDTDVRNEENLKLHNSMISWMVHILIKGGKERPSESWDHELLQLQQELISFNMNIMRDSADIEMISDDKKDLRSFVQQQSETWMTTAKKLLSIERKHALARDQ